MASVIVLYTKPEDVEGFEQHYLGDHARLVQGVTELETFGASRILGTPRGTEAPYYVKAEMQFPSMEALQAAMRSDAMMQVSRDAMQMCQQFGMSAEILVADTM
jgi:uncharacterized protein (TIGR02118 family)